MLAQHGPGGSQHVVAGGLPLVQRVDQSDELREFRFTQHVANLSEHDLTLVRGDARFSSEVGGPEPGAVRGRRCRRSPRALRGIQRLALQEINYGDIWAKEWWVVDGGRWMVWVRREE